MLGALFDNAVISVGARAAVVTALVASGVLVGSQAAWAADPATDPASIADVEADSEVEVEVEGSDSIVINGRTFGPAEGLEIERGEITLNRDGIVVFGTDPHVKDWGSSYVDSDEKVQFIYDGEGYAAANVFKKKRYIRVCFKYTRGGKRKSKNICSAAGGSTRWEPGPVVYKEVYDSLDPDAPPTKFHYWSNKIDPKISP